MNELVALAAHELKSALKALQLIDECIRTPFTGRGKPEPLRHDKAGWWSRRITDEHRLVYRVIEDRLEIAQCRYHY
ncbi:Txe/YoeB family addiction module toxin [Bosea sp. 124]|uniref:Txe/YoeB family addiction module toxin n=1 Tax=Bosea sp. 124 TaxID=2135642 RepID=UPI0024A6F4D4|nr:Txe/YoeB family addiction module toxin [Bosea sp. 124]